MNVDGLISTETKKRNGDVLVDFSPANRRTSDKIRLTVFPEGNALVSFMSAGLAPDPENGEIVSIHRYDEDIARRIVSALAVMHLNVEEAETHYSEIDIKMIENKFVVGILQKEFPAWIRGNGIVTHCVVNSEGSGLPAATSEAVRALHVGPGGHSVIYQAHNLNQGLQIINNGLLQFSYNPKENVNLIGETPKGTLLN